MHQRQRMEKQDFRSSAEGAQEHVVRTIFHKLYRSLGSPVYSTRMYWHEDYVCRYSSVDDAELELLLQCVMMGS